ncbi:hypothetical protein DWB77_07453 [Streptomyces hundungensis]|uniref:Uncharacterized protein n=1 Tax=Streptomyces hundungensis TaxID=1077946 RepID=A0A387HMT4_9ACTN|nr:hypothetical protein [Streptomyces hundungensis]AYG85236.1 hypothetical protein DWB77_07453 [Streptomyces hundungensis]
MISPPRWPVRTRMVRACPWSRLDEARESDRLLMHFSEAGNGDSEEEFDAYALAADIAGRLPYE